MGADKNFLCETHCYLCPHIFLVYYFILSQCEFISCCTANKTLVDLGHQSVSIVHVVELLAGLEVNPISMSVAWRLAAALAFKTH